MGDDDGKKEWREHMHKIRMEMDACIEKEMAESTVPLPSNEEIISLIPSKAVREYLRKNGHVFGERDRELLRRYLKPQNDDEFNSIYEVGRYVSLPHPFRRGDIVAFGHNKDKWGESYDLGIMRSFDDDAAWTSWDKDVQKRLMDITDFSDVATTVEFLMEDGSFSHNHPNPMELEFAKDIPGLLLENSLRTSYLQVASDLIKGDGSLELYEMYKKSYQASPEHLIELLQKVKCEILSYKESFETFKTLSKKEKDKLESELGSMEISTWRITHYVEDCKAAITALTRKKGRGTFYKEITDEQKKIFAELLGVIFSESETILSQVEDYIKLAECPRKRLYQRALRGAIKKLSLLR